MTKKAVVAKEGAEIRDTLISALLEKGRARFMWLGTFKVVAKAGGKRYDFKKKAMVPHAAYKTVRFTPAEGLYDILNPRHPRRKKSR
jgi:nucleoid DNA-binding protein